MLPMWPTLQEGSALEKVLFNRMPYGCILDPQTQKGGGRMILAFLAGMAFAALLGVLLLFGLMLWEARPWRR